MLSFMMVCSELSGLIPDVLSRPLVILSEVWRS